VPAVRQAASVIPIVFAGASEPVVTGEKETQRGLPACAWPTARRHSVRSSRRLEKPVLVLLDHRNTTSASLARRARRLFVDYLRNGRGTTAVGALFTARTRGLSDRGAGKLEAGRHFEAQRLGCLEVDHKCEFKYLVCNMYDATLKIIAVAKVKANIVIHICSSIAWQAGAQPVSQPPAPGLSSSRWTGPQPMIRAACA
jgi:hypothetical protein